MIGIAVVDKPPGITSHDAIYRARRALGIKRIGHAGTLDPQATGVLVLAIGHATRVLQFLPLEPKVYEARITFGVETNTQDTEGEIVAKADIGSLSLQGIRQQCASLTGAIQQLPPMFSAVKREGKPLYVSARKGIEVEREPRTVVVESFEMHTFDPPEGRATVVCSSGTYVRTLAHDLGKALGCGAHLSGLRRTAVGRFRIDAAIPPEDLTPESLISIERALEPMSAVRLTLDQSKWIRVGQAIPLLQLPSEKLCAFLDENGRFLAVAENNENIWQPRCVIPREAYEK